MGNPIDRTAKTALDGNLVNGITSDAPKVKANNDAIYNYSDTLNAAHDAHAAAATLAHPDGSVKTAKIADGAVTTPKYADASVTLVKLAPESKDSANHVYSGTAVPSVTTTKAAIDVTYNRLLSSIQAGTVSEVSDARVSVPSKKTYSTLKNRLDDEISYVYDKTPYITQWKDLVFGREYLTYYQQKAASGANTVVFSGDSTTDGYALVDPANWTLDKAFIKMAKYQGLENITTIKRGQSGMSTEHWNRTYVQGDMSANPDLLVLRWGINDPAYDKALNHLADDGQNYSLRRNVDDFKTSLYAGLQQIRNSKTFYELSIILMTPNSTSDDLSFRNEAWHESINAVIRMAARQFNCCFIDTYRLWQDSRNAAGFMDVINQGHIHPLDLMNLWITDVIFNVTFPQLYIKNYSKFGIWNTPTLGNGWSNLGGENDTIGYQKSSYNNVKFKGVIQSGTVIQFTELFTIPTDYAPSKSRFFVVAAYSGYATLKIMATGSVQAIKVTAGDWIDLSSINYAI